MIRSLRTCSLLALLLAFSACQAPQSTLHPIGPASGRIATLEWIVLIVFCVIGLVVWLLLFWAATRKRGTLDWHAPWNESGGHPWILIGGFAVPFVVLTFFFVYSVETMAGYPIHDHGVKPEIKIIGHQFWWELRYVGTPADRQFVTANEIHIPVGRPVDVELISQDVIHSFWVPVLHGKVDLIPGQDNYIRIQADQPGTYHGQCAEYCGEQHAHMGLLVVAQSEQDYQAWFNQQLEPAAQPTAEDAMHGHDVFMGAACVLCHTIRGTEAHGAVAPDLTHLASRQELASNSFPNDKADLEAWITHAQSMKPGAEMPDLAEFNGPDLRALVAYLQQLH